MTYAKTVVDLCRSPGQPQMAAGFLNPAPRLEATRNARRFVEAR